jgi:hypothetical protein
MVELFLNSLSNVVSTGVLIQRYCTLLHFGCFAVINPTLQIAFLFNGGNTQITPIPASTEIKTKNKDDNRSEGLKTIKAIIPIPIAIRSLIEDTL